MMDKGSPDLRERGLAALYEASESTVGIPKIPTGIAGLDALLLGGLPARRLTLVTGEPGAGKTVLANEFLYHGIRTYGEPGVFVTFEERPADISANVSGFGWDYASLVEDGWLTFVDFSDKGSSAMELNEDYDLSPVLIRIRHAIERTGAQRVVLDSMATLFARLGNVRRIRDLYGMLADELKAMGVTTLATAERQDNGLSAERGRVEEYVADGSLELYQEPGQQRTLRRLIVRKLRGTSFRSGRVDVAITENGLEVYPKIPVDRSLAGMRLDESVSFGIQGLDALVDGGLPKGHLLMVGGNTGTGKSTFAMQFTQDGLSQGESVVYVALEEPSGQIIKFAEAYGWPFQQAVTDGRLHFVDVPLIDIVPDQVLYRVLDAALRTGAQRIIVDSASSLQSATMESEDVRQFLIQLNEFCKSQGLVSLLTYLSPGLFGAARGQLLGEMNTNDMRLSSVVDGVIILRYVERGQKVKRLLNVLKMRGRRHSKAIYLYDVTSNGIDVREQYEE